MCYAFAMRGCHKTLWLASSLVVFDSNLPKADEKHMTLRIKNLTACIKERRIDV
jgi:hypothetical protein